MEKCAIILGVSADIGKNICKFYLEDGFRVLGTYRQFSKNIEGKNRIAIAGMGVVIPQA